MASYLKKELEKHLECGICLGKFEEPKMLRCQHSYCKKCLERLVIRRKIKCPECREETEVLRGDVTSLPANFLTNSLLSIRGSGQSHASQSCEKHDGEILKLFCQSCDELICRDCVVIDHRDHKYTFIKDIIPAEKEKIVKIVVESRLNILALETSIETIKVQKDLMHENSMAVNRELDNFINKQIELLERKRQSFKDDLRKSVTAQEKSHDTQMESFLSSLAGLKSSVEFTEQALSKGSEVEVLSAKIQMSKQLKELNKVTSDLKPRGRIYYSLEANSPLNNETVENIAKIREYDKEYVLVVDGILGNALKKFAHLVLSRLDSEAKPEARDLAKFIIRPKSKSRAFDHANKVQVKISSRGKQDEFPVVTNNLNGSFSFSYCHDRNESYDIEVLINGRYVHGSPFKQGPDTGYLQSLFPSTQGASGF